MSERAAHVALALTPGVGSARMRSLQQACGSAGGALAAPFAFLCTVPGISRACATAVSQRRLAQGEEVLAAAEAIGAVVLLPSDQGFPAALHDIPDPPAVLFALGDPTLLARPAAAVVGSRSPSGYGVTACRQVSAEAASAGLVVVSGMARGLDAVAHTEALDRGGATIGVLGNGLGVIYPSANRLLYERVAREALLLTEHPPGERPHAGSFPRRNRLISGLARVTVVVEAAAGSGALITADCALEQGRDVMALPGPINSPVSVGTNRLLRDGAMPYLEPGDLAACFPELQPRRVRETATQDAVREPTPVSTDARAVLDVLALEPVAIDALATRLDRPAAALLAALCELEMAGLVAQLPGWSFRRTR